MTYTIEECNEAWDEGYESYFEGDENNPYTGVDEGDLFEAWADGYTSASWDDD